MDTTENTLVVILLSGPIVKNKCLRTNHACTLCGLYGNYYYHFQDLDEFQTALSNLQKHSLASEITVIEKIHPLTLSSRTMTIYMIPISNDPSTFETINDPTTLTNHCFSNNEEILEALINPEYPWDDMHHCSFFIPEEPVSLSDQFSVETKDFIH